MFNENKERGWRVSLAVAVSQRGTGAHVLFGPRKSMVRAWGKGQSRGTRVPVSKVEQDGHLKCTRGVYTIALRLDRCITI